jgi:peptidoglycan-associated lipoprotein
MLFNKQKGMKNKSYILSLVAVTLLLSSCAQYYVNQGDALFNAFAYKKATKYYEKAVARKKKSQTLEKLAECYFKVNEYKNAEKNFKEASVDKNFSQESKLHYGQTLMSLGKYSEAKEWLNQLLIDQPDNQLAKALIASCNAQTNFIKDTMRYSLTPIEIKGFESFFSPIVYKEGIIFAGEQTEVSRKKIYSGTMRGYQHIYYSKKDAQGKFAEPVMLNGTVNSHFHSSSAAFNKGNFNDIYYSSISTDKLKMSELYDRTYNMAIHHDTVVDNEWKRGKDFPFNSVDYSNSHPAFSNDGKTMFFVSDMPGGFGGSDLYVTTLNNGEWTQPKNLGLNVNTAGNECFPSVAPNGKLYFSSNGLKGIGGLDVFAADYNGSEVSIPMNLNYPLNSKADDFGVLWNADMKSGYVSSNRVNADKIYTFVMNPYDVVAEGIITGKESSKPLSSATVIFRNTTSGTIDSVNTDSDGKYSFKLTADCDYVYEVRKTGYFTVTKEGIDTKNLTENKTITTDFVLQQMVVEVPYSLDTDVNGRKILFDLDKWNIRKDMQTNLDALSKLLKDNPTIMIELAAHTDSRADNKYNQKLSEKRAKSTLDYLVKSGINKKRMKAVGYGETKLTNNCSDGVQCAEEEHQQNRRTEFTVLKDTYDSTKDDAKSKKKKK